MFLTSPRVKGRKSKKSKKENVGKNPLWTKKHLLIVACERFPAVHDGARCVREVLAFCVLQYFSIRFVALLDFNYVVCCISIGYIQPKWVWYRRPCAPNQILMKARGSKIRLYPASGQPRAGFRAAVGVTIADKRRSWWKWLCRTLGARAAEIRSGSDPAVPTVPTVAGWVMYRPAAAGGGEDISVCCPALGKEKAVGKEDLQGWVLGTTFNQQPQHRVRALMKSGTGEELGSVASADENRMVAQKEGKDPKVQKFLIKFGGMEYQHHMLWGQISISATSWEPML